MFKDERPGFFRMAAEASGILRCCRPGLLAVEPTMRVVAITAGDQLFLDPMPEWLQEVGLGLGVTRVAKLWLLHLEQGVFDCRLVRRMAVNASDLVVIVDRPLKIDVFVGVLVAS
jgi:hypothetical protein